MSNPEASTANSQQLVEDIKAVIATAEEMLAATAGAADDKVAQLRARIEDRLLDARVRLRDAEAAVIAKSKAVARATDDYVHESPWQAVGIAAGVGLLIGLLIGRR